MKNEINQMKKKSAVYEKIKQEKKKKNKKTKTTKQINKSINKRKKKIGNLENGVLCIRKNIFFFSKSCY